MVASSSSTASFAKAIRVKQFPPMIVVDVPTLREVWKQWRNSIQEKWMEHYQQRIKKQPALCTHNHYIIPVILPSSLLSSKQNIKEEPLAPSWKDTSSGFVGGPFVYFLLGALVAHWFQIRRNKKSSSASSSGELTKQTVDTNTTNKTEIKTLEPELSTMQQKLVQFDQRLELVETHQKIDRLERQLLEKDRGTGASNKKKASHHDESNSTTTSVSTTTQQQDRLPTREVQWTSAVVATPMMLSPSMSSSCSTMEDEEARMNDRMLAAGTTRRTNGGDAGDDLSSSTTTSSRDGNNHQEEDVEEVGVLLQDFQSELQHIQETLRTGNFP